MVLVRFPHDMLIRYSGLDERQLLEIPWKLGGESKMEGDSIIMEFNPDRPDLYSIQGVTRAMRLFTGAEEPSEDDIRGTHHKIVSSPPESRPYFLAAIVKGVNAGLLLEQIIDFQEKLHTTIGRNRKFSAIGLHDLSKVVFPLTYGEVARDHRFRPLGGDSEITLSEFMGNHPKAKEYGELVGERIPAITDANGEIISLPPILNSSITEIGKETRDIFVDVTGTNYSVVYKTLMLMITSLSYGDGKMYSVLLNGAPSPSTKRRYISIPTRGLKKVLGYDTGIETIENSLTKMGYLIAGEKVLVPLYRFDILHDVDVVEDIIKGIGFENVRMSKEEFVNYGKQNALRHLEEKTRVLLLGYGMNEVVNAVLTNGTFNRMYGFKDEAVKIQNPLSLEQDHVRTRIAPSLMHTLLNNFRNQYPQRIYEIGTVHRGGKEIDALGIAVSHREASFSEIKGLMIGLLEDLDITNYKIDKYELPMFVKGRLASVIVEDTICGFFGEVDPLLLRNIGLKMPVALGELDISEVLS